MAAGLGMSRSAASKVWLISGCSSGFGREIALAALEHGDRVVVTARRPETVADICARYPERGLALELDVTKAFSNENMSLNGRRSCSRFGLVVSNSHYGC